MTALQFVLILISVAGISIGQVLFKLAAMSLPKGGGIGAIGYELAFNPYLLAALASYFGATILWIWVLREVPLNLAYPLMALAFLFTPLLGAVVLGEALKLHIFVGAAAILVGVWISVGTNW